MSRRFIFAIATLLLVVSPAIWALGLGEAKVLSFLNQPLKVHIDLITRPSDDLDSVSVKLASADDFAMVGASLAAISVPLEFSIEEEDGEYFVLMTSRLGVTDPVVRVIIEVNWSSGRMLREYTLLLDPPTFESAAPAPAIDRSEARRDDTRPVVAREAEREASPPRASDVPADGEYGPVQSGDTLWRIASDWAQGTDMDLNQVMLAIQEKNPAAFLNNNINLLRQGATLQMPDVSEIRRVSESEALAEVREQSNEFNQRPDSIAEELPLFADESEQADEPAAAADTEVDDRLELVPPQSDAPSDEAAGIAESGVESSPDSLREALDRTEEQLISEQQQNEYLQRRIDELEGDLAEAQAITGAGESPGQVDATLEDAGLAAMEERLALEREEAGRTPSVQTAGDDSDSEPWYSNLMIWLGALLVAGLVAAVWFFRRRDADAVYVSDLGREEESVQDIIEEVEDIQRALEPGDQSSGESVRGAGEDAAESTATEDEPGDEGHAEAPATAPGETSDSVVSHLPTDGDATVLDEESADPEIKLDLARAYISMGDKEAARAILEEVLEFGNEEQREEAKKMHDGL